MRIRILLGLLVLSSTARAETESYRGEMLLADAAGNALLIASVFSDEDWLRGVGGVTYAAGVPALHAIHGRPGAAAGSIGLRLGLPLVGGVIGMEVAAKQDHCQEFLCGLAALNRGFAAGLATGVVAAEVADNVWLAEPELVAADTEVITPVLRPLPGGVFFGVTGRL